MQCIGNIATHKLLLCLAVSSDIEEWKTIFNPTSSLDIVLSLANDISAWFCYT